MRWVDLAIAFFVGFLGGAILFFKADENEKYPCRVTIGMGDLTILPTGVGDEAHVWSNKFYSNRTIDGFKRNGICIWPAKQESE